MTYQSLLKRILGVNLAIALFTGCSVSTSNQVARPMMSPAIDTPISSAPSFTPIPDVLTRTMTVRDYQYITECSGEGRPAVLLLGGRSAAWKPIQAEINRFTRTCVFEHMGNSPTPLTAEQIANNVHILVKDGEVAGPYVLVGYSVGGYIARLFTNSYPDEVAGMVLLDSSHEDQNARFLAALSSETSKECQDLKDYRTQLQGPHLVPIAPQITLDFDVSATQVRAVERDLGNLPLVVLTAGRSEWPDCFQPEVQQQLDQAWLDMQNELASLSTNSTHLVAEESGHSFADHPGMVIDAIQRVIQVLQGKEGGSMP